MLSKQLLLALLISFSLFNVVLGQRGGAGGGGNNGGNQGNQGGNNNNNGGNNNNGNNNNGNNNNGNNNNLQLDPNNVQDASADDGNAQAEEGQAASDTDEANFINFCSGKTLTNGLQQKGGSCNGVVMGDIPAQNKMVSTIIQNPGAGDDIQANTDFNVEMQIDNLEAGSFTNPDTTYYSAPQQVNNGQIVGHTHVTIQTLGNDVGTQQPPDASSFVFFKGVNDAGDGNGGLTAAVDGGLPAGAYRVCTMASSSNHQPVIMPVAQRGAQDDCQKFTVGQGNGNNNQGNNQDNNNNNGGNNNGGNNNGGNNNGQQGGGNQGGQQGAGGGNQGGQGAGGQQGGGGRRFRGFGKRSGNSIEKRQPFIERQFIG